MIDAVRKRSSQRAAAAPEPQPAGTPYDKRVIRIKPSNRFFSLDVRELWHYRELGVILAWRDIKLRYKQTFLGVAWAVIQPVMTMIVLTVIFGGILNIKPEYHVPYALFSYTGLLPWIYFNSCLTLSSTSIVSNSPLVTKVYFPRLLIPLASIISPLVDFLISSVVLAGLFVYYGRAPHWHTIAVPVFMATALVTALGIGLWLSALSVRYRDVPYTLPFLTQLLFFMSPLAYPASDVPQRFRWLFALNPVTGVIDGVRWTVLGRGVPHYTVFGTSAAVGLLLLVTGLVFFRHTERTFADVI
jgi:lipopolysaccharide transport system permease protein